jgi:hypothetical protein
MTYPRPLWPLVLGGYLAAGLVVGVAPLQHAAALAGLRPGIGTAIGVNIGLPLLALCIALWKPYYWTAWIGGFLLAFGFFLGALFRAEPKFWMWTSGLAVHMSHPILIAAAVGCGVVGTVGVLICHSVRELAQRRDSV